MILDYSKKEALAAGESLIDHLKSREKMTKTKGMQARIYNTFATIRF